MYPGCSILLNVIENQDGSQDKFNKFLMENIDFEVRIYIFY